MKKILLTCIAVIIYSITYAQTYKTYKIAYVQTPFGNFEAERATLRITQNQIFFNKNGEQKQWKSFYRGITKEKPANNIEFQYECYQLGFNKVIKISKTKNVKHNGKFYYASYVDGQLQLLE